MPVYNKKTNDPSKGKREGVVKYVEHWQTKYTYEVMLKLVKKMERELNKYLKNPEESDLAVPTLTYMCGMVMKIGKPIYYQMLEKYKGSEIDDIHTKCYNIMEHLLQQKALKGEVNAGIASLTLKSQHNWVEQQHIKTDNKTELSGNVVVNINQK